MAIGRSGIVYVGSLLLHAGVAVALVRIEPERVHEATSITVVEVKKPKAKQADPPPPPPPPPVVQAPAPKVRKAAPPAPAPAPEAPPPPSAPSESAAPLGEPPPMFGLTLSGGVGAGAGGIAVPLGNSLNAPPATKKVAAPKALVARKDRVEGPAPDDACLEALVKPKPIAIPQPVYATAAREAGIAGKVRVELTVDESGNVVEARVIEGLGYGLDEAALEAARASRFEAATRCGKATRTTFVIGVRFAL